MLGGFKNDKFHGNGVMTAPNGQKIFEGEWRNGHPFIPFKTGIKSEEARKKTYRKINKFLVKYRIKARRARGRARGIVM